ncbi:MAG: hypothetical protein M0021_15940 [Clostridia bacterium]|nr:hypothetical protein [Clostridia bacterium]
MMATVATNEYDYRGLRISKTTASGTTCYHKERLVLESDTCNQCGPHHRFLW